MNLLLEKLVPIIEENKSLKLKVEYQQTEIEYLKREKRNNNIITFDVEELEKSTLDLIHIIKRIFKSDVNIDIDEYGINKIHRIGNANKERNKTRPVLCSFVNGWKKSEIIKSKKGLKKIYVTEDFPKEILTKRKALQEKLEEERKKGKIVFLKYDKLVVKENEFTKEKRENERPPFCRILRTCNLRTSKPLCPSRIEELKGISERIAILNIKISTQDGRDEFWSIIQAYSPTEANKKEDVDKIEDFYKLLQKTIETAHKNVIVTGDFNDQIGECHRDEKYTVGSHGGVKKAFKELDSKKNWMPNMRNEQGKCTRKRIEILNIATEYYKNLYQSKLNKPITSSINDTQDSKPVPLVLKEETERAIMTRKAGKAPDPDNFTNELLRTSISHPRPKAGITKYREYNKVYFLGFVDFHKAFDSLEHQYIRESLERQGVQTKYIRLLKIIYEKSTARIKLERKGEEFSIERGVRQGDPISPKLFSAALEIIFRRLSWERFGLNVNGENLSHLRFANDLVLFSECPKALEKMLQQLSDEIANAERNREKCVGSKEKRQIQLERINEKTKFRKVQTVCKKLKWQWTGHMLRERKEKWTKLITEWYPRGNNRIKGRQTKRWDDDLKKVAGPLCSRTANQRNEWKALDEAFVERQAVKRGEKTECRE
ncbi:Retrovirus-related Pol polyprotein from type-1 retrotransposable element R2 [Eumeta japonica]|uniref:Retrovirus-related Pol polyprotein from type-1 retrotransposable element R2 n=1 Tax=Eumeta variegata TaxID=151549 RepID=A0A4C1YTU7_EUMVA|nr:Retrovirus-related Pol polyprotein from type-1 retrotransposable element R2 [Eumeta japonica]